MFFAVENKYTIHNHFNTFAYKYKNHYTYKISAHYLLFYYLLNNIRKLIQFQQVYKYKVLCTL